MTLGANTTDWSIIGLTPGAAAQAQAVAEAERRHQIQEAYADELEYEVRERTRELAKSGFVDSLGIAPDSYGWEGRSEWKQEHPEKAAALFAKPPRTGVQPTLATASGTSPTATTSPTDSSPEG